MSARRKIGAVGVPVTDYARCDVTGKIRYDSRGAASKTRSARRNKGARMRPYLCNECHGWHLTKQGATGNHFKRPKT